MPVTTFFKSITQPFNSINWGKTGHFGENYRFTFNGKELDAASNLQDYGFRIYNPSIGKFLSVDPLTKKYPELTPYQFASNTPIQAIDLDGLEGVKFNIARGGGFALIQGFVAATIINNAFAKVNIPDRYKHIIESKIGKRGENAILIGMGAIGVPLFGSLRDAGINWGIAGVMGVIHGQIVKFLYIRKMEKVVNSPEFSQNQLVIEKYEEQQKRVLEIEKSIEEQKQRYENDDKKYINSREYKEKCVELKKAKEYLSQNEEEYKKSVDENSKAVRSVFKIFKSIRKIITDIK